MPENIIQKIRIVTAASLFDGHDAAINIMRRILQSKGVEVIHLGHNRSVHEIVETAIEEDVQAIAITSYQGGHVEFFKYMKDLLDKSGCGHIKIFGGGGGTILPVEIRELQDYGITRIYSPDDGRQMGLEGMIEDLVRLAAPPPPVRPVHPGGPEGGIDVLLSKWNGTLPLDENKDIRKIARAITFAESGKEYLSIIKEVHNGSTSQFPPSGGGGAVLGITGTGGAGKSSVTDEIVRRFLTSFTNKTIAVISVDPSKKKTGGALLGDRIRMNSISHPRAYMRSMATRDDNVALSSYVRDAIEICKRAAFDFIILESAGVGQGDASILEFCDISMYVMTPEYGAASQLEKINMLDYADIICINKFDKAGAKDALIEVKKQYKRNHGKWDATDKDIPVIGTTASKFNDEGVNHLFEMIMSSIKERTGLHFGENLVTETAGVSPSVIPPSRTRYLSEITEAVRNYNTWVEEQSEIARKLYQLKGVIELFENTATKRDET